MNLLSKWRAIIAGCEESAAEHNHEGPCAVAAEARAVAFSECARDLDTACMPRAPKAEWFGAPFDGEGKPTGKWDAWWCDGTGMIFECRIDNRPHAVYVDGVSEIGENLSIAIRGRSYMGVTDGVIPVAREGFPAPVGWAVVGG